MRLTEAVRHQDSAAVRALLAEGAPVNETGGDGFAPLHWAAQWNHAEIADLLIAAGADANAATRYGVTPLTLACINASAGMVERLLLAGADPLAAQTNGETALMTCARTGAPAAVNALLDRGADVNAAEAARRPDRVDVGGLGRAYRRRAVPAGPRRRRGRTDDDGLHGAAARVPRSLPARRRRRCWRRVRTSTAAAADGTTALVIATIRRHLAYAEFLLDQGADPQPRTRLHAAALGGRQVGTPS